MFRNYLKIAFRNLWKNKGYMLVNVFGLTIALAGFIFILLYLNYEKSYDKWSNQLSHVYRVDMRAGKYNLLFSAAPDNLPGLLTNVSEVNTVTRTKGWFVHKDKLIKWKDKDFYIDDWMAVDTNFFRVYPYHFIYGSAQHAFDVPNYAILNEKCAKKYFANSNPLGEKITVNGKVDFIITGVIQQPQTPSEFEFNILVSGKKKYLDSLPGNSSRTYLLLNHPVDTAAFGKKLTTLFRASSKADSSGWGQGKDITLMVEPFQALHLHSILDNNNGAKTMNIIFVLGILIVLLACINYTNLSIAQSSQRATEIGIRKVVGASRGNLILYFLLETTLLVIFSVFLSLTLTELLLPTINHLLHLNLILWNGYFLKRVLLQVSLISICIILISGGYPALVLSGFAPVKVLKGNTGFKGKNIWLRQSLLFIQLIVFVSFITCTLIIYKQVHFLNNRDYGINMNGVIMLNSQKSHPMAQVNTLKKQIAGLPGVLLVSNASSTVHTPSYGYPIEHNGEQQILTVNNVDYNFFKLMGIPIEKGRAFDPLRDVDSSSKIILNAAAAKQFGITEAGDVSLKMVGNHQEVIGIAANSLNTLNLKDSVEAEAYRLISHDADFRGYVLVKLQPDHFDQTINEIKKIWHHYEPGFPLRYSFLDHEFALFLVQYQRLSNLFSLFALITIWIALMGLLALASFNTRQRTKEIGIRKVLGASVRDILKMINRSFFMIILVANIISIPIVYLLMKNWLNDFAYRIDMPVLPFIFAIALSIILTVFIVSMQALRAARANPVNALKYE